jgi:cell division septation protein DedD
MTGIMSIYRVVLVIGLLLSISGCRGARPGDEKAETEGVSHPGDLRFDPLELPADKEIVPQTHPRYTSIVSKSDDSAKAASNADQKEAAARDLEENAIGFQVYRVQLFTSELFGEAQKARLVAEEIFDRPVYLDYEVPYYKLRVGDFADRGAAEEYQMRAKAVGYSNAWVVMTNVNIDRMPGLYDSLPQGGGGLDDGGRNSDDSR